MGILRDQSNTSIHLKQGYGVNVGRNKRNLSSLR